MAKSKYEYVKKFELDDGLLPDTFVVVRIDGRGFTKFCKAHNFKKPNDDAGLGLMNFCAKAVVKEYGDIELAYGQSDEYSFVFKKNTTLYNRRASKIQTNIVSLFASNFVFHWKAFFPDRALQYPPTFDARCVCYPSKKTLRDYLSWRQADCHINNLYNTTFWCLVNKYKGMPTDEATGTSLAPPPRDAVIDGGGGGGGDCEKGSITFEKSCQMAGERLRGTVSSEKNEIMFSEFGLNYNQLHEIYKKGSVLIKGKVLEKAIDSRTGEEIDRLRKGVVLLHVDVIGDAFWKERPALLRSDP
eukprot:TRINITY_DN1162_c0_g1_i2.p1 TRINITY_DN1162_c0_g1~~TRINITY_DN1162_c0_g1_i2.p1  ORF type:complete len:301 (-),score=79.38 TRINITY_DN1162_c0_g1_i2:23-925(-)